MSELPSSIARGSLRLGHAASSQLRWVLADVGTLTEALRIERDLSPLAAIGLGQMLASAAMLNRLIAKRPTRMLIDASGDGPLGRVRAEADTSGHLRGLVGERLATSSDDSDGVPDLGSGMLRVMRQTDERGYESNVALVAGGVARNVAHYLERSEQIRSAVFLGVQARRDGIVAGGGLIVQAMPDAEPETLQHLEGHIPKLPGVSSMLEEGGPDALLENVLREMRPEAFHEAPLKLSCDCDRGRFLTHIRHLVAEDPGLLENEDLGVECSFCGAEYVFETLELEAPVN